MSLVYILGLLLIEDGAQREVVRAQKHSVQTNTGDLKVPDAASPLPTDGEKRMRS